ncbi:MAG: ATP-binding cassette domain-containing protein [Candidatus Lokiarchaeota archaeon]|nr:ATP-binding cassette domain-containing protein [Candidatus Lokiarchaeota archaeon]
MGHRGPRGLVGEKQKRSRPVGTLLRRMFGYLGKFRKLVAAGAVLSLIGTFVNLLSPIILRDGLNLLGLEGSTILAVFYLVIFYLTLRIFGWLFNGGYTWILAGAQAGFVQKIQKDVYDHLIDADLSYHKSEQSGDVTSRVTSDTDSLGIGIQVIIDVGSQLTLLIGTFIVLILISPTIAFTSLIVVPGVIFIAVLFGTVGQRIMLASRRAYGKVSGQIAENLSGVHIAKAFNREEEIAEQMLELNEKAYKHGFRFMILMSALQPLVRSMGIFAVAAILFVGGSLVAGTAAILTTADLFLGVILLSNFMWPLLSIAMMASQVQASLAAMDRISDVIEAEPAIADTPESVPLLDESDGIKFCDVTFSYVEDTPVLKNIDFHIEAGETVALVGHTGAGKTTIAALINRFYDPDSGCIKIGDQDLRDIKLESLHSNLSLIPQIPYLFDGTIIENIRYGNSSATDEEIFEICRLIGADDFIDVLAEGYDTYIIEDGKNLSAGQKQMITIARTMLANPKILILDEATSRLDAYSESLVQEAQEKLFAGRTTIVIAHRLTTIANASRIFVFEQGELIEQGTHEELLAYGGVFKNLYDTYYAHQGITEISEDIASVASLEVSRSASSKSSSVDLPPEAIARMKQMGMDPEDIPPEMMEKIRERIRSGS